MFVGITSYKIHDKNGLERLTRACIRASRADGGTRVVLVDHGTTFTNDFLAYCKQYDVEIVRQEENNLSKAWNTISKMAVAEGFDSWYIFNNDAAPIAGSLYLTSALQKQENLYFVGSITPAGRSNPFSAFLMTRALWEKVGEFDEQFWLCAGDFDYEHRITLAGLEQAVYGDFLVFHFGGGSVKSHGTNEKNKQVEDDALALYIKKWGEKWKNGNYVYYTVTRTERTDDLNHNV